MKKYRFIFYSLFIGLFFSCKNQDKLQKEKTQSKKIVKQCEKKESIFRLELNLFQTEEENLDSVLTKINYDYSHLFKDTSLNFFKGIVSDTDFNKIFDSVYVHFKEDVFFSELINGGFCVLESYFPDKTPSLMTMIDTDIIDEPEPPFNPVRYYPEENLILIQLQWFLGKDHVFYNHRRQSIPEYLTKRYDSKYIPPFVFYKIGSYYTVNDNNSQLLDAMINQAKPYLFTEIMLPKLKDNLIFGATESDIIFFNENVEFIWKYILENRFLFSSESILKEHFIIPSNTTQLGTPGRFGVWIGWQILRSYFNNNDVTLQEVLQEKNSLKILNKSNYKP